MKNENKGITLIALIITIIVMLILVGITLVLALNGELFSTTKDAAEETQIEVDRETLQSGVIGALNEETLKIEKAEDLEKNLPLAWNVTGQVGGPYKAISPNNNTFSVDGDGSIHGPVIAKDLTELEKYILGEAGTGRDFTEIFLLDDMNFNPENNPLDVEAITGAILNSNDEETKYEWYMKYDNNIYKFQSVMRTDGNTQTFTTDPTEGVKLVYESKKETNVGKYVQYDGEKWIVLYDDDTNGLQMISENVLEVNNVYLGYRDGTIDESKVEEFDGENGKSDLEKAVYSYNHAIATLNKKCESLVTQKEGVIKGVRSVGSNPTNPSSENAILYTSNNLATWANGIGDNRGYSTDYNFVSDFDIMIGLGINKSKNEKDYWLASRILSTYSNGANFGIRIVGSDGNCDNNRGKLWNVLNSSSGKVVGYYDYCGVRPVVSLETGVLDELTGEGTAESPLILE